MVNNFNIKQSLSMLTIALCLLAFLSACGTDDSEMPPALSGNASVSFSPTNYQQFDASAQIIISDGSILYAPLITGEANRVFYVLGDNDREPSFQLPKDVTAVTDNYIYYSSCIDDVWMLSCYDINSKSHTVLMPMERSVWGDSMDWASSYFADNTYFVHTSDGYIPVKGNDVGKTASNIATYTYEQCSFCVEDGVIWRTASDGTARSESYILADGDRIIPCANGLLIHNPHSEAMLNYFDVSGDVFELVNVPCKYAISTVATFDGYVYLSYERFESEGFLGTFRKYPNDTMEGTYKIRLEDFAIQKISDHVYNGLFIFDDTGIYACNDDGISKINFDGTEIACWSMP